MIPRRQAVREVAEYRADWSDDQHTAIYRRHRSMIGERKEWIPLQSGVDGPLVLQLI
jgi:hypothetical protein